MDSFVLDKKNVFQLGILAQSNKIRIANLPVTSFMHSSSVSSAVANVISVAFSVFTSSSFKIPTASK